MVLKEFMLDGLVALVTGAGRGIGRGIALTLADGGADVACVARTTTEIEETAADVRTLGRRALALPADVTQPEHVVGAVQETLATLGHVDILVNNAGVVVRKPVVAYPLEMAKEHPSFFLNEAVSLDEWHRVIDTSLTAAFLFSQELGHHMMERRRGKVINIITIAVGRSPFITGYNAAKGGLAQFTRALAREWGPFNIQVNAIGPYEVPTAMTAPSQRSEEATQRTLQTIPLRRFGTVRDVGLLTVYLASEASDYMTGQCLYLDGGFQA